MDPQKGGIHAETEEQERKECQGDLKTTGKAKHYQYDSPYGDQKAEAESEQLSKVYSFMKEWTIEVIAHKGFDNAQVSAGGVSLKEVDGQLESRVVPGLYLAGEVLDVDGRCGGYNLQWAWSSGRMAGLHAGRNVL